MKPAPRFIVVGFLTILVLVVTPALRPGTAGVNAAEPRNVLLLVCDDLNTDLGAYGVSDARTPNIDRLAASGRRFERAYCQFPLCGPSRASFLSGLYPQQTGVLGNGVKLRTRRPRAVTLPQAFLAANYETVRVGKLFHQSVPGEVGADGCDDAASWSRVVNPLGRDRLEQEAVTSLVPGRFGGTLSWMAADGLDMEQTDGIAASAAVELLEDFAARGRPFFLAVGLIRPHTPFVAPRSYFALHESSALDPPGVPQDYLASLPRPAVFTLTCKRDQLGLDVERAREVRRAYRAAVSFVDAQIGRILAALERVGLAPHTVVALTSDHGYHLGEHGHWQKGTLFENAARVPLVLRVPGMRSPGRPTAALAELVDLAPTLLELTGVAPGEELAGRSLVPVLRDVAARVRTDALTSLGAGHSLRTWRYRYTEWGAGGGAGVELYDHERDPEEIHNLADDPGHAGLRRRLSHRLRERVEQARGAAGGAAVIAGSVGPR